MPRVSKGYDQLNLTFPAELIHAARKGAATRGTTLTAEVRRALERLAGASIPIRGRGRPKKKPTNLENT